MPVSLERLIAEVEPAVVTDELIRDCIVVSATEATALLAQPPSERHTITHERQHSNPGVILAGEWRP